MSNITELKAPRLDANSESVIICDIAVENGAQVAEGQLIATVESTKKTEEFCAPQSGYLYFKVAEGDTVNVDETFAVLSDAPDDALLKQEEAAEAEESEYLLSGKAKKLLKEHNIPLSALPKGKIIREKDILKLIKADVTLAPTKTNQVVVFTGGGHAKMCIEILKQTRQYEIYGISDINYPDLKEVLGIPVLGDNEILPELYEQGYRKMVNGLGTVANHPLRKEMYCKYKSMGFEFPNLIHPTAMVEPSVSMGEGNQIMMGAIVGPCVKIGSNCIVNSGAIVSHDSVISDHVHIAPGAVLGGSVKVGENTLIGMGTTIYFGVKIGSNVVIHNGCNIYSDVPDGAVISNG